MVSILEIILLIVFIGAIALVLNKKKKKPKRTPETVADVVIVQDEPIPPTPTPNGKRKCFHFADIGDHAGSVTSRFDANEWLHIPMVLATSNLVDDIGFSCEAGHKAPPTKAGLNRMIDSYAKKVPNGYPSASLLKSRVHLGAPKRGMNQPLPEGGKALIKALSEHTEVYVGVTSPSTTLALALKELESTSRVHLAKKARIIMLGQWNYEQDKVASNYVHSFCKKHGVFLIWGQWKQYAVKNGFPEQAANNWVKNNLGTTVWGKDLEKLYPRLKQLNGHLFKESDHNARNFMLRNLCGELNKGDINNPMDFKRAWLHHHKRISGNIFEDEWRTPPTKKMIRGVKDNANRIRNEMFLVNNWMGKQLGKFKE